MNWFAILTWPVRPLTKRVLRDLNDFDGIRWQHVTITLSAAATILFLFGFPILAGLSAALFVVRLNEAKPKARLVVGRNDVEQRGPWLSAMFDFWLGVMAVVTASSGFLAAGFFCWCFTEAAYAYGAEDSDDDDGEPFVVRQWQAAKSWFRTPAPATQ